MISEFAFRKESQLCLCEHPELINKYNFNVIDPDQSYINYLKSSLTHP